ncbi:ferritin-like domain-containing protein [Amycolatopsis anabasis]|uniref:ferritin-like domain-containing protein n=1 Tax=Amycolatopsis anabasis TaxID=1840409 RepID=UPI00131E0343|nr:ferritin-like domain-containing protein [Amycolatopsis anabasis]
MSYLSFPRLHFSGSYQADPSTINNKPERYDIDLFQPRFQREPFGGWNPKGTGALRFQNVSITSAFHADGRSAAPNPTDPAVDGSLIDGGSQVSAKLVDLDPEQQLVSQIWGLELQLVDATGRVVCRGDFTPTSFADIWNRGPKTGEIVPFGASYQSVLTDVRWLDTSGSPFLDELRETTADGLLSIKFNLDGFQGDDQSPDFTFGRIVGSIGAYQPGEPTAFVAARRLRPQPGSTLNDAPCRLDEATGTVLLDLGNSLPTVTAGGNLVDLGELHLAVLPAHGRPVRLAPLDGIDDRFYRERAGVAAIRLEREHLALAAENRLAVLDSAATPKVLLAENAEAGFLRANEFTFRLYPEQPHDTTSTTLVATRFGRPAARERIFVTDPSGTAPLKFPASVVTDENGRAELTVTATDPGNPRGPLDGLFCALEYTWSAQPDGPPSFPAPHRQLNILVQSRFTGPDRPTWVTDVQPIFQQYANLYPVMRDVFDLANYHHVVAYRHRIRKSLLAPRESPGHMPVTRDLSPGKRDMIVRWLGIEPEPPMLELDTVEELRRVLQQALAVEHSTIPVYLTALFSLKNDRNLEVARIIRGVVLEEMLHMALVGNILNAVGGTPVIGRPGFVPVYPGPLPGGVLPSLRVSLRKCSIEHIRDVFLAIEQPEYPTVAGAPFTGAVIAPDTFTLDDSGMLLDSDDDAMSTLEKWYVDAEYNPFTIGWYYNQLAMAIIRLDDQLRARGGTLFTGDPARQVRWPGAPGTLYQVTDRRSALLAIHEIIEQGEGSPHDVDSAEHVRDREEFGHYYRFKEIVEGRELIRDAQGKWVFEGAPIPFDPDGVHPMVDNPDTYALPENTPARAASQLCDRVYAELLSTLHQVFNGQPGKLGDAVGLMYSVQVQAKKLLSLPSAPGADTVAGPSFQV